MDPKIVLTAVDQTKQAFDSVKQGLTTIQTKALAVTGAISALGAGASMAALTSALIENIQAWDELGKAAQRAGFQSAQGLAEFQFAAKLAGVDAGGFETAIGKLESKMADAAGGGEQTAAMFTAMGIKVKDAAGNLRSTEAVLTDLAKAFSSWGNGPEKSALALQLFEKQGKQLIPLLNGGADGLEKLRAEFRQLRGVLDDGTIKASEQFNDNLTKLEASAGGLKRELAERLLPGLNQITDAMVEQAKKGGVLLATWAGLAEFTKMAFNLDETGKKITGSKDANAALTAKGGQLNLLLAAQQNGGDSEPLRAEITKVRGELEKLQADALAASRALKLALNPNYTEDALTTGDFARMDRKAGLPAAPIVPKVGGNTPESAYAAANKTLTERIAIQNKEIEAGRELTEMEKLEAKILQDLKISKVAVTATEKADIAAKIEKAKVNEIALKVQKSEYDQAMEIAKERQRVKNEGYDEAKKADEAEIARQHTAATTLKQIEFETSLIGLNNEQREVAVALHELENQGITKGTVAYETYAAAIAAAAANRGALTQSVENFKGMWESIDSTAHDVWTNIWHGGNDTFKRLGQTLKASLLDVLYQMVVKKWIFNIFANVAGASGQVTNAVGNGVMQGATSSFIGGSAMLGGGSLLGAGASATMSNGLIGGFGANMANIGTLMEGGSYLTALSAAAPYLAIGLAAISMLSGSFKGETRSGGQYSNAGFLQGPSGGEINGDQVRSTLTVTIGSINDTLKALGSTATLGNLQSGFESSENGKGFAYAGGQLSTGQIFGQGVGGQGYMNRRGSKSPEQAAAEYSDELKQVTLQALQAADVPGQLGEWLRSLGDIDALSGGALDAAINRLTKALTEKQQLEARIFDLTATDAEKLTKARTDERAAIDVSNQALLDRVYALQDEKTAADAAAAATQAHADALTGARNDLSTAYDREKTALQSTRDRLDGFTRKFITFRDSLLMGELSPLTPGQKYAQAASDYAVTVAQKNAGDLNALDRFDAVAQAFLEASRVYNASGEQYTSDFNQVYTETNRTVTLTQMQYDVAVDQLHALDAMVGSLLDVKTAVLTVGDAIRAIGGLAPKGSSDFLTNLYSTDFNRAPDAGGYAYWSGRLATGASQSDITAAFLNSPEYLSLHSHKSGLYSVPYDNYGARLHRNEAVLTEPQANAWRSGNGELVRRIESLERTLQQGFMAAIAANQAAHEGSAQQIVQGVGNGGRRAALASRMAREALPAS